MRTKDVPKLLKLAHMKNWPHKSKWDKHCPVCNAEEQLSLKQVQSL